MNKEPQEDQYPLPLLSDEELRAIEATYGSDQCIEATKYTEQELDRLHAELVAFKETKLHEELERDAQVELERVLLTLIEEDQLKTDQLHTLRGEARALYRVWKRTKNLQSFLETEINEKREET